MTEGLLGGPTYSLDGCENIDTLEDPQSIDATDKPIYDLET